ncbi:MAG: LD-carboxypeptidase [Thermodesulfobacteria bacterium]|nr:LD-carboxypeptidase [Thermodesulfobacteriota bacterium]
MEKGKTIGIVAPCSLPNNIELEASISYLKEFGFEVENLSKYFSAPPFKKAKVLLEILSSGEFSWLWAARGGAGGIKLLPYIKKLAHDFEPKAGFIGFSDATILHSCLYSIYKYKIPLLHAPVVTMLPYVCKEVLFTLRDIITKKTKVIELRGKTFLPGYVKATVLGGNLASFSALCGTEWFPKEPCILLLEEINEPAYRIERWIFQLIFNLKENLVGIVFGNLGEGIDPCKIFHGIREFLPKGVVVGYGFKIGHCENNFPFFFGRVAELKAEKQEAILRQEVIG